MADTLGMPTGEKFKLENYETSLANMLSSFRKKNYLCDVVLVCRDREYLAHRIVLSAASPFFRHGFTQDQEAHTSHGVKMQLKEHISPSIMEDILQFMYLGEICVHKDNVRLLIAASDILQMTNLKDLVCRFYEKKLCASNCLSISSLADEFNCKTLKKSADAFIYKYFADVSHSDEFKSLNVDQVIHIISNNKVNVKKEEKVYEAVIAWIDYDQEERFQYLLRLMENVRLLLIDKYYLFDKIASNTTIMQNIDCQELVLTAINFQCLTDRRSLVVSPQASPRQSLDVTKIVVACGGVQDELASKEALCYVPDVDFWYPLAPLHEERSNFGLAVVDHSIFAIGGDVNGKTLKSVEFYNFALDKWTRSANLPEPTMAHGAGVLNNEIYVVGSGSQGLCSDSVFKYDAAADRWTTVKKLKVPRRGACVVSHLQLYAIGGYGPDGMALASVERYDPYLGEWAKIFPMNSSRAFASGAVVERIMWLLVSMQVVLFLSAQEIFHISTDDGIALQMHLCPLIYRYCSTTLRQIICIWRV
ncbi:kelch-like protein 3 [Rhopilema esculentum]|uniref:kelch-like protein 3 n=1 Tax=Rhopilema esculentum TaxID=499914 RepID=UPI0031D15798|eukprot:gene17177-8715_t